jgi:hypothetical protein
MNLILDNLMKIKFLENLYKFFFAILNNLFF